MNSQPKSLQQAILHFANPDNCLAYLVRRRWPNGVACPICGASEGVTFLATRRIWQCKESHARRQFSIKVGTIFEDSAIGLDKWLVAIWMIANCKNGISSYEIHRTLKVTQKSAWFMLHRIRLAMQDGSFVKLGGNGDEIEADESFIGGKARNMHKSRRAKAIPGSGYIGKVPVMGILERGGQVRLMVINRTQKRYIQPNIRQHVAAGSALYTDALRSYDGLDGEFAHQVIDHAVSYAEGKVHTNGLENFWSLLKRGLHGTYISVEPFHLFRYLDEQSFRYNNRATKNNPVDDGDRFHLAVSRIVGKRLTYAELTGKVEAARQPD